MKVKTITAAIWTHKHI